MESLGYGLESAKDAASGARLKSGERYLFCPGAGGILPFGSPHATGEALPVSENTIKLLRLIKANRLKACLKIKAENVTLRELEQVTRRFYRWIAR
ncbi:MAG: DNA repair protein RecO C-terminal domain-containing protein [Candidatus Moraniibacteriota bacterium]